MVAAAINAATPKKRVHSTQKGQKSEAPTKLRPPPLALTLVEGRGVVELAATFATRSILRHAPRGDGHSVLV
ncbi:MAG: hypothetical protein ACK5ZD_02570, partial [Hyphomonadaceae bacterium]